MIRVSGVLICALASRSRETPATACGFRRGRTDRRACSTQARHRCTAPGAARSSRVQAFRGQDHRRREDKLEKPFVGRSFRGRGTPRSIGVRPSGGVDGHDALLDHQTSPSADGVPPGLAGWGHVARCRSQPTTNVGPAAHQSGVVRVPGRGAVHAASMRGGAGGEGCGFRENIGADGCPRTYSDRAWNTTPSRGRPVKVGIRVPGRRV